MTPSLSKHAAKPAPRYTSYPTAPHFTDAVGDAAYRGFLRNLDPAEPISLYLHVPFCRELCWYCGCNMKLAKRDAPIAAYVQDLLAELRLLTEALPGRFALSHLAWGGGTPTALTPDDMERAMDAVRDGFDIAPGAELSIESDPRTLTDEMTRRLGKLGFTRASFGVQEFHPDVQAAINRIQPPGMVRKAVNGLRSNGVEAINFDLIYGLPKQSVESLLRTIDLCDDMRPDRLALFGYAHVPWMAKKQRMIDEADLPSGPERVAQAAAAAERLIGYGYEAIGLDHFALAHDPLTAAAREGRLRRNFQGYTTDTARTLLGLGSTAIGRTPSGHVQNLAETGAWAREIADGRLPIARGHAFEGEDLLRADVIEALMCRGEADLAELGRRHGAPERWAEDAVASLKRLAEEGFVALEPDHVALTEPGRPLMRLVAAAFDAYRETGAARHSVAV
ncbi:MAG: oxygen-independent coproporphyrinogen III oxidase [Pseudomonadota bacterium]